MCTLTLHGHLENNIEYFEIWFNVPFTNQQSDAKIMGHEIWSWTSENSGREEAKIMGQMLSLG